MALNAARGEAAVMLGGERRRLCLTLGALAEMETGLALDGLEALGERMRRLSARDLMVVLAALLRGGGEENADALARSVDPKAAAEAVAAAFAACC